MASEVVGIEYVAEIAGFKASLKELARANGSANKEIAAELNKSIKALDRQIKSAVKSGKELKEIEKDAVDVFGAVADAADDATSRLEGGFGHVGSSAGKLAGALDLIAPGAGSAAQAVADLADVGEVGAGAMGVLSGGIGASLAILGPLALAVGAAAWVWSDYSERTEQAKEAQERWEDSARDALDLAKRLGDALLDQGLKARVASGDLTELEAAQVKAAKSVRDQFVPDLENASARLQDAGGAVAQARDRIAALEAEMDSMRERSNTLAGAVDAFTLGTTRASSELDSLRASLPGLVAEQGRAEAAYDQLADAVNRLEEGAAAEEQAQDRASRAKKASTDASKALTEQLRAEAAATSAVQSLAAQELAIRMQIAQESGDALLAIKLDYDTRAAAAQEAADKVLLSETATAEQREAVASQLAATLARIEYARVEAVDAANAEIDASEAALAEQRRARAEAEAAADDAAIKQKQAAILSFGAQAAGAADALAQAVGQIAEQAGASQAKTAMSAFRVHQGAAIAEAVITTIQASLAAYASMLTLGPIGVALAPASAAATAAFGAAQVAAIAASPPPKFHSGYAPDEVAATLKRGEGVLSGQGVQAAGGADGVRALNAGHRGASGISSVVVRHDHRYFDAAIASNLRAGGTLAKVRAEARGQLGLRRTRTT